MGPVITVSESSRRDIYRDFRLRPGSVDIIPLGVDTRVFHPRDTPRRPGRIVAVASAESPVKGLPVLLRAVAKVATERDVRLTVVGKVAAGGPTMRLIAELSLADRVRFTSGLSDEELAGLLASAEIAVVPSLYEGFSLPAPGGASPSARIAPHSPATAASSFRSRSNATTRAPRRYAS